jgi:xanthine dehydrogenase molybdenum-binding subunit
VADQKLVGQNYVTPDLVAKVTGQAKYAEDFRAEGMLFAKLLLSPIPHGRVRSVDTSAAEAMPGVKAILRASELPSPADTVTDLGETIRANPKAERALTDEPVYAGEAILAVAAVDEETAAAAIEAIRVDSSSCRSSSTRWPACALTGPIRGPKATAGAGRRPPPASHPGRSTSRR